MHSLRFVVHLWLACRSVVLVARITYDGSIVRFTWVRLSIRLTVRLGLRLGLGLGIWLGMGSDRDRVRTDNRISFSPRRTDNITNQLQQVFLI